MNQEKKAERKTGPDTSSYRAATVRASMVYRVCRPVEALSTSLVIDKVERMAMRYDKTILGPNDDGRRLDRVLRRLLPQVPLSRIFRALRSREITVSGHRVHGDTRVREGDVIEIAESVHGARRREPDERPPALPGTAADLADRIVFENEHVLVVAKRLGELTHGPDSLEERVRTYLGSRPSAGVSFRPGPAHRLDRTTTGLVVFGISLRGAQAAAAAFRDGAIRKRYVGLFEGRLAPARWDDLLDRDRRSRITRPVTPEESPTRTGPKDARGAPGKGEDLARRALTVVEPMAAGRNHTIGIIRTLTGRTHQIRAQAALHGCPLAGDRKYGSAERGPFLLHAASLTVASPDAGLGFTHLWTELPEAFRERVVSEFGLETADRIIGIIGRPL